MSHKLGRRALKAKIHELEEMVSKAESQRNDMIAKANLVRDALAYEDKRANELQTRLDNIPNPFKFCIEKDSFRYGNVYQIAIQWDMMHMKLAIFGKPGAVDLTREVRLIANEMRYRLEGALIEQLVKDKVIVGGQAI